MPLTPEQLLKKRERVNQWLDAVETNPFAGDPGEAYDLVALNLTMIDEIVRLNGEIEQFKQQQPNIAGISGSFDGVTGTRKYTMDFGEYNSLLEQNDAMFEALEECLSDIQEDSGASCMDRLQEIQKRIISTLAKVRGDKT